MKKLSLIKSRKNVAYAMVSFVMIKKKKKNSNVIIKSEIIAITPENLEELLIIFAI